MHQQGAQAIAKGLRVHTSITDLSLADNPLRTEGLEHICQALAGLSALSPFLPVPPCSLIHVLPDATLLPCLSALSLVLARKPCVRVRVQMAAVRCSR